MSLWQLAFRPFFLLGALHALCVMLLWIGFLGASLPAPGLSSFKDPFLWHSHEMVYGFLVAIIAGFVLTAAQNWTGIPGVKGGPLRLLVALWVLARILVSVSIPGVPPLVGAIVDLSFLPVLSFLMFPYLKDPELKPERFFFLFFGILFVGNLMVHLQAAGLGSYARQGIFLGLDTVILIVVFIGGRVIPFFTESSVARSQPRTWEWVEYSSHATAGAFLVTDVFFAGTLLHAIVAFAAAGVHFIRLWGWQVRRVRRIPLVWVLHAGYLWLVIGFVLSGLVSFGIGSSGPTTHAFTVGALGVIIYGMISRVALGHTGRRLHPSAWIVAGYVLLLLSALIRVFGPLLSPNLYLRSLTASGMLWAAAFTIYVVIYTPILLAPRVDGRPG